jgi:hypothetical protein
VSNSVRILAARFNQEATRFNKTVFDILNKIKVTLTDIPRNLIALNTYLDNSNAA